MALQKPKASKAPAYTQPAGGDHSQSDSLDPCCIPISTDALLSNSAGSDSSLANGESGTFAGFIPPTAH